MWVACHADYNVSHIGFSRPVATLFFIGLFKMLLTPAVTDGGPVAIVP
jgi:hypothetical protein